MEKILFQIKDKILYIKRKVKLNENEQDLVNTNIISDNELLFSSDYIIINKKIITSFIKDLTNEEKIDTVYLYNTVNTLEILEILKFCSSIKHLVIKTDFLITFKMVEEIKDNENLKTVSVQSLHDFFADEIDKSGKIIEVRNELFFTSNFIKCNNLNKYSSLLYKKAINIEFPLDNEDEKNFQTFVEINKYLKVIHINKCIKSDLENIINILVKNNKKDIKIILHENILEEDLVEYIHKINKKYKKNNNLSIMVSYTDNYLRKNILPQTNINILKTCIILILILVLGTFIYYLACNYVDEQKDNELKTYIQDIIQNTDTEDIITQLEEETNKKVINEYIASLLTINKDIVGWITVPGTEIDYPIVLGEDNSYYLTHDIQNNYTRYGSIFMNYTNESDFTDDNTVLFGHNFYGSTVMFSTLKDIDNDTWLSDESNHIITIDTLHETLEYKVFSYYITDITNDYLATNYINPLDTLDFFLMLEQRSEYDFNIDFDYDSKILTLSTCANSGAQRFVVHAVLITD